MNIDEAKAEIADLRRDEFDDTTVKALDIALWLMEREAFVRAMEDAYYDTDSRHAFQSWEKENPKP